MSNGGSGVVHDIELAPVDFYSAQNVVKRLVLVAAQVTLDLAIFWLCLHVVLQWWAPPFVFWSDRKLFFCGVLGACFFFNGLYGFRAWMFWDEMREVLKASLTTLVVVVVYLFALKVQLSRMVICTSAVLFVPTCLLARYLFRRAAFALELLKTPILIVGAGKTGELYAKKIAAHPFMGCQVMGFLDDDPGKLGAYVANVPVLGCLADFPEAQQDLGVEEIVVAIPSANRETLAHILDVVEMRVKRVSYIPDMHMLTTFSASIRDVEGLPVISASQGLLNPLNRSIKFIMDIGGACIALAIFSPLMLYVAYRIKKEDGGPVFFLQKRVGYKTDSFVVCKFRSMFVDAEERTKALFKDEKIRQEYEASVKLKNDPRVTKIGAMLRKTSLDELPQLLNVLKGEMSLIGPRPLLKSDVDLCYGDEVAKKVYSVKPGLTGFWQVSGRSDLHYKQRAEMNLYYIRNWSVWLDIIILMRTVRVVLSKRGAY